MEIKPLSTTVVGSFPLRNTKENVEKAFKFEVDIGITYPCYPQLDDMNLQFLRPLSNDLPDMNIENGHVFLTEDIEIPNRAHGLEFGKIVKNWIDSSEIKDLTPKACLTGPFTLTSVILLKGKVAEGLSSPLFKEPRALVHAGLVEKFAQWVKKIAQAYSDLGFKLISIDEPVLGLIIGRKKPLHHDEEFITKMLNIAFSGVAGIPSTHVCGVVPPKLIELLLQSDCKILDHEFTGSPTNFQRFSKDQLEQYDKYLALGSVETKVSKKSDRVEDHVETIQSIKDYISKAIDQFGKDRLLIKPDCGFGPLKETFGEDLGYKIAQKKLENMVAAVKELK